jgi:predicted metalloprotease with PDZ domain
MQHATSLRGLWAIFIFCLFAFCLFATIPASAQRVVYRVDLTHTADHYADITIQPLDIRPDTMVFQMPVWAPGIYSEVHYGRFVQNFKAVDSNGHELSTKRVNTDRWRIAGAADLKEIHYRIENSANDNTSPVVGLAKIGADGLFANTEAMFGYLNNDKGIAATMIFTIPKTWAIATTLEPATEEEVTDENRFHQLVYNISNYEELAEAPLMVAPKLKAAKFNEGGVQYWVVATGDDAFPVDSFAMRARNVVRAESSFFGKLPFEDYMFAVYAGSGRAERYGIAHLNSSVYTIPGADWAANGENDQHIIATTFFQTWNGKQFHISPLGPVDYSAPIIARSLWFNEGLSDYYADLLMVRYGALSPSAFFHSIDEWQACAEMDHKTSLEELSMNTRHYDKGTCNALRARGALAALLMDIEIRSRTKGKLSLDNVLLRMSHDAPSGKTYEDKNFIRTIEKYSTVPLDTFGAHYIAGRDAMPVEAYLTKIGAARELPESMKADGALGLELALNTAGLAIVSETAHDSVFASPFEKGDTVTAINGEKVTPRAIAEAKAAAVRGEPVKLKVVKNAHSKNITVLTKTKTAKKESSQLALRQAMLGKRQVKHPKPLYAKNTAER